MSALEPGQVLDVTVMMNDQEVTLREYLGALLLTLWAEGSNFSGKRPFGFSSWQFDVYAGLIKAGYIEGSLDEDGYVEDVDVAAADALVLATARTLFVRPIAGEE